MAVRSLNAFEQHAGKLFLGVVTLVALLLIWLYVFGEGVTVQVGAQAMTLKEIQGELAGRSQDLAERVAPDAPPIGRVITLDPGLAEFYPDRPPRLAAGVFGPIGAVVLAAAGERPVEPPVGALPLNLLRPPTKPTLSTGQGSYTARVPGPDGKPVAEPRQARWVAAYARLPYDSFREFVAKLRRDSEGAVPKEAPLVLRIYLERQVVDELGRPIGPVERVPRFGNAPATDIDDVEKKYPYPGRKDPVKYQKWRQTMKQFREWLAGKQAEVRRPKMYGLVTGGPLVVPGLEQERQEWLRSREIPGPGDGGDDGFKPGEQKPDVFRPGETPQPADLPPAPAVQPPQPPGPPGQPRPGERPAEPGEMPSPDPNRDNAIGVYAIDETVGPNMRVRYRLGYELLNPMLNLGLLRNEKQEHQVALAGPLSPWSEPIQTGKDLHFYLARALGIGPDATVQVDVFRMTWGRLFRKLYTIRVGVPLGGVSQERGKEVDFRTGMLTVDIRREAETTIRRPATPGGPVALSTVSTIQVVLMDARGGLHVRSLHRDMDSAGYKALLQQMVDQDRPKTVTPPPDSGRPPGPGPGPEEVPSSGFVPP